MSGQLNLIHALKNEKIVSISDVESGKKCNCVCPACGEQLVAKKGKKQMHHFAHAPHTCCEYGYESSLHFVAKEILSKTKKITIPPVYVKFSGTYKEDELISEAKEIAIDRVELEKRYSGIVPDVVVYAGGKQLFVEIYVTHAIDEEKLKKLQKVGISTIEINLSKRDKAISSDELEALLLTDVPEKQWKYNSISEKYLSWFRRVADERLIVSRGLAMHVDDCPIRIREWRGKAYANYMDDCLYCEYCIESDKKLLCSGRTRIATIESCKQYLKELRIRQSMDKKF